MVHGRINCLSAGTPMCSKVEKRRWEAHGFAAPGGASATSYVYTYLRLYIIDLPMAMASVASLRLVRRLTLVVAQVVPGAMDRIAPPTAFVPGSPIQNRFTAWGVIANVCNVM